MSQNTDLLISLPAAAARAFVPSNLPFAHTFATSDPPGSQLGSGGGTAHLLEEARRAAGDRPFDAWLAESRKLMIHGSGQSRRLPAYAAEGKLLLPLPFLGSSVAQNPDQHLLDVQAESYARIFRHAPQSYRLMVACGDVLLQNAAPMPTSPEADILIAGIAASPEEASHHGVMFCDGQSTALSFFLQKPSPDKIRTYSTSYTCYLDTGVWLFSARAVACLLRQCGWNPLTGSFADGKVGTYELFDRFAEALGSDPVCRTAEISGLTAAVLPLPAGRFYHFGTNRSVLNSVAQLMSPVEHRRSYGHEGGGSATGPVVVLHASCEAPHTPRQHSIWIESSRIGADWRLAANHVLTGIPQNHWALDLPDGVCIDCMDVQQQRALCLRVYGFDDPFRGRIDAPDTLWQGRPLHAWLAARSIDWTALGLPAGTDIQAAPLFPLLPDDPAEQASLAHWLIDPVPAADPAAARRWLDAPRLSAADLLRLGNTAARQQRRDALMQAGYAALDGVAWATRCQSLNLAIYASLMQAGKLPQPPKPDTRDDLAPIHHAMLMECLGGRRVSDTGQLRTLMVERMTLAPLQPRRNVLDDQIIWGRAPARIDLAGGWTDTPPYCLKQGGRVVNLALDLNGQPPVQAFARLCAEPEIVLHSIDLGITERITSFDELLRPAGLGDGFAIARAALRLAGFDPHFAAPHGHADLRSFLRATFGGGIALTMLAAIPKGSGMGTSSILAATILGTLGELCALNWTNDDIFRRTLALEQILGSGGGWQDQVGGIAGGAKLIETEPGLEQRPVIRWLPGQLFEDAIRERRLQLYYTGITRVAHNILGEIVQGIFLNDTRRIGLLQEIGLAAQFAADAVQRQSWSEVCEAVQRSWTLNQALDSGTNPPEVQTIFDRIAPHLAAAKLTGAGGGGYMAILAHTTEDAVAIRETLARHPPNNRARFVTPSLSTTGLQITRS